MEDEAGGGPAPADQEAASASSAACLPMLDLILSQANPKGDAEIYIRCFRRVGLLLAKERGGLLPPGCYQPLAMS